MDQDIKATEFRECCFHQAFTVLSVVEHFNTRNRCSTHFLDIPYGIRRYVRVGISTILTYTRIVYYDACASICKQTGVGKTQPTTAPGNNSYLIIKSNHSSSVGCVLGVPPNNLLMSTVSV